MNNSSNPFSDNEVLAGEQLAQVAGGDPFSAGMTFGGTVGWVYWGARNYLSETVYPYWLD